MDAFHLKIGIYILLNSRGVLQCRGVVVQSGRDTRSHMSDFGTVGYNVCEQFREFLQWVVVMNTLS